MRLRVSTFLVLDDLPGGGKGTGREGVVLLIAYRYRLGISACTLTTSTSPSPPYLGRLVPSLDGWNASNGHIFQAGEKFLPNCANGLQQ